MLSTDGFNFFAGGGAASKDNNIMGSAKAVRMFGLLFEIMK